jgi:flagellar motor switch protein FliN/FliY
MPELHADYAPTLLDHVNQQLAALAESFNQCFDLSLQIGKGEVASWNPTDDAVTTPGVVGLFQFGDMGAAVWIPETCALPAWFKQPNDSQKSRLDTLAMEWGMNLFPPDFEAERTGSFGVAHFAEYVATCQLTESTAVLRLPIIDADLADVGALLLVWPFTQLNWEPPALAAPPPPAAPTPVAPPQPAPSTPAPAAVTPPAPSGPRAPDPLARLRRLPVTVSVLLAERRITMSQLLAITPGALLTFNKSCDDLLDLYVNNSLYCRGEAVKISESFGLKINEVGIRSERPSKIIDG